MSGNLRTDSTQHHRKGKGKPHLLHAHGTKEEIGTRCTQRYTTCRPNGAQLSNLYAEQDIFDG
jgi:hypothetical protein